jgi:hypothetical protein
MGRSDGGYWVAKKTVLIQAQGAAFQLKFMQKSCRSVPNVLLIIA